MVVGRTSLGTAGPELQHRGSPENPRSSAPLLAEDGPLRPASTTLTHPFSEAIQPLWLPRVPGPRVPELRRISQALDA